MKIYSLHIGDNRVFRKIRMICTLLRKAVMGATPVNLKVETKIVSSLLKVEWRETKRSFGTLYPDKTFYVIRVRPITTSIGGLMLWVCKQLEKCDSMCDGGG